MPKSANKESFANHKNPNRRIFRMPKTAFSVFVHKKISDNQFKRFLVLLLIASLVLILSYYLFSKESSQSKLLFIISLFPLIIHGTLYFYAFLWNKRIGSALFKMSLALAFAAYIILLPLSAKAWYMRAVYPLNAESGLSNMLFIESLGYFLVIAIIVNLLFSLSLMWINRKDLQNNLAKIMAVFYSIMLAVAVIILLITLFYSAMSIYSYPLSQRITGYDLTNANSCDFISDERQRLMCFSEFFSGMEQCRAWEQYSQYIKRAEDKYFCEVVLAIREKNPNYCPGNNYDSGANCFGKIAYFNNDIAVCDILPEQSENCLFAYAVKTLNPEACRNIKDSTLYDNCIAGIKSIH